MTAQVFLVTVKLIQLVDNFSALSSGEPDSNLRIPVAQTTRLPV